MKRVEISLRRHQFQLQRRIEKKQFKNRMKEKACQQMKFTDWFWKALSPNGLSVLLARRKKRKTMLPVSTAKYLKTRRSLVEDFFLPVIKPPGTYFNSKLLPSCRSSKFSSSFPPPAFFSVLRWIQYSKNAWRQSVLIFLGQTLHWKFRRVATSLIR